MALSILVTVAGFLLGAWVAQRFRFRLVNPVVVGVVGVLIYLRVTKLDYQTYAEQTKLITTWLSPAVVGLALPLHERTPLLKRHAKAILFGLTFACVFSMGLGILAARALHLPKPFPLALASRSVTAPIAMAIAERSGGAPTLAGAIAILTGMTGATLGLSVLRLLKVTSPLAKGFAVGAISHGIGTARVLEEGEEAGAAAALGMCLNGIATALLLPWLWRLL